MIKIDWRQLEDSTWQVVAYKNGVEVASEIVHSWDGLEAWEHEMLLYNSVESE